MNGQRNNPYRVQFSFGSGPTTPTIKQLLIAMVAIFFVQTIFREVFNIPLEAWFGVVPYLVTHNFFLWQPFTYIFLHGGLGHIALNLLVLWMFGCELERVWGKQYFLKYFFMCGVGAGLCCALITPSSPIPTIGASGAIYGILLAYGVLYPTRQLFIFPFPVPIQGKYFVLIIGLLAFYSTIVSSGSGSGVSHIAHLSGLLIGYVYLRGWGHIRKIHRLYLERKLKNLKKKFHVVDPKNNDQDKPPFIH